MAPDHGRGGCGFSGGGVTAPEVPTVTKLEVLPMFGQSEMRPKPDLALADALRAMQDSPPYYLAGTRTTLGNAIEVQGATGADRTANGRTDQSVRATGFAAYTGNQVSPGFTFAQMRAARRHAAGDDTLGVVLADPSYGGQEILAFDTTRTDKFIGANQVYHLREAARVGSSLGIEVTAPWVFLFQGTQAKDTPGAQYRAEFDLVYGQLLDAMTADYPAVPALIGIVNGGDVNTTGDIYDTPEVQYRLLLDYGGIIAGWQRAFKISDANIHTSTAVQVLQGETAERAAFEAEAGNPWNITYQVVKSGASVTVTFALRPGETLMEIADLFDDYGGAATCPHFGFEAEGGISAASWTGNTVTLTLNNASAGWLRLAQQVQNVSTFADANGLTMSAHRSTLFGSHTWPSLTVAGETIRRPVPGFSGTFSGDTFTPEF